MPGDGTREDPPEFMGVAGRWRDEQEKSYVRQAAFLLRYRLRALAKRPLAPEPVPQLE